VSIKRYCLVPATWNLADCSAHSCGDGSHVHLSRAQLWDLEADGLIEWMHRPANRHDKGIVQLRRLVGTRGLSARVGAVLAEAVRLRLDWALLMLSDIRS
jgi:hypothetical protein